jgi:hypothetical protein
MSRSRRTRIRREGGGGRGGVGKRGRGGGVCEGSAPSFFFFFFWNKKTGRKTKALGIKAKWWEIDHLSTQQREELRIWEKFWILLTILFAELYCDKAVTKEGLRLDGKIAVNFGRAAWEAFILELKKTTEIRKTHYLVMDRGENPSLLWMCGIHDYNGGKGKDP